MKQVEHIYNVLKESKEPMKIQEIELATGIKRTTIMGTLNGYLKKGKLFVRVSRGRYTFKDEKTE